MIEYQAMRQSVRLAGLRGSIAAAKGQPHEAIRNCREMLVVARHAAEEGTQISVISQHAIYLTAVRHLAIWAFIFRREKLYGLALKQALESWPKLDLQKMHRSDLLITQMVLKLSTTEEGRQKLGLKPEDVSSLEPIAPMLFSRSKADVKVVKEMRLAWEAYAQPANKRADALDTIYDEMDSIRLAYPTGTMRSSESGPSHYEFCFDKVWESRRVSYLALQKVLAIDPIPSKPDLNGFLSPFTRMPLAYSFDGKKIAITCGCTDPDIHLRPLTIPPDPKAE